MDEQQDGALAPQAATWVQELADRHYGGNVGRAAAAIIEAAFERARHPGDPWAELDALQHRRLR